MVTDPDTEAKKLIEQAYLYAEQAGLAVYVEGQ
jgi:hypothetical protein